MQNWTAVYQLHMWQGKYKNTQRPQKLTSKQTNQKRGEELNREFSEWEISDNKYFRKWSTSLAMEEIQVKAAPRHLSEWLSRKPKGTNAGEDVRKKAGAATMEISVEAPERQTVYCMIQLCCSQECGRRNVCPVQRPLPLLLLHSQYQQKKSA